jgi:hypothetical protein
VWNDILKELPEYQSAVLTWIDNAGYPFSVRCTPKPDYDAKVLRMQLRMGTGIKSGPASLLYHYADEQIWNTKSFLVRGTLEQDAHGWILRPQRFIPGVSSKIWDGLKMIRSGRRLAKRYLEKRSLSRPEIPWDEISASWKETKKKGERNR